MEPTSPAQFAAFENKSPLLGLDQVREDVWSVGLPQPGPYQPHYSLSYLLRDTFGRIHVIDTGIDYRDNWERLVAGLAELDSSPEDVVTATATHGHPDHTGLVPKLQAAGAVFQMHHLEQAEVDGARTFDPERISAKLHEWGAPEDRIPQITPHMQSARHGEDARQRVSADHLLDEGDVLDVPGFSLRVLTTPGHTPGSTCFIDDDRELVFTGDHLLPNQFPAIGTGGNTDDSNPYPDYLAALAALPGNYEALPGHGFRFRGLGNRVRQTTEHHLRRTREVEALLADSPGLSVWELASRLTWTAGWENLAGYYLYSAVRQTDMHRDYLQTLRHPADSPSAV